MTPLPPPALRLDGLLGEAMEANRRGRLSTFVTGPGSPAIAIFDPARRAGNEGGDWYGEHAGKWLVAASRAAQRSGDEALRGHVAAVADHLAACQEPDGYLGNYPPHRRFDVPQPPRPESWNGEPALRTWDVWTHSYLVLGLVEAWRLTGDAGHLRAAARIGDLCHDTFVVRGLDITTVGNHHGMSATVLLDPAVELYRATAAPRYLELAETILAQADAHPRLALLRQALDGADASEIATGKAYQLCWNLVGLAKLHRATGRAELGEAVDRLWRNIRDHHLSLGGGPFGGIGHRSREVFNPAFVFDPGAYIETCSVLAWMQLNRELLLLTGQARYAEELERSAYNDLLGAAAPNGEDWCYYSFANGRRIHTKYWRCCKSSGAMALEELQAVAWTRRGTDGVSLNLLAPGRAEFELGGTPVAFQVRTGYPHAGTLAVAVAPAQACEFEWQCRLPAWAGAAVLRVNGEVAPVSAADGWLRLRRRWQPGDRIEIELSMSPRLERRTYRNVQESLAPDGSPVRQQVLLREYVALARGPLAYATGLIDGYRTGETVLPPECGEAWVAALPADPDGSVPLELRPARRAPIVFRPYYGIDGRTDGAWRITWLEHAPAADHRGGNDCGDM
ncbi:hypothetical protein B1992_10265 [Pseudoxanthomonas broegbernensis]|uniref:Glycoside hydrolase family 127 protein n=1 Tax=Pseudoxanthomonas broegbernensis TaxID=83619 RepID=A0A7V8GLL6_9GAMM|nr:beta-L-arabinofuranosidase domain-containing protein [Pseudoxanthomonas broegbernensis]KAF1685928.1 hypothetical protein B1992_10265 [Pseudoxanthomonas broegbernensis]MBB6064067.1 hypothetical protein [Pseudoxanthomonas broegbernensis]